MAVRRYDRHHTIQTRLYIHKFETMFHMVVRFLPYPRDDLVLLQQLGKAVEGHVLFSGKSTDDINPDGYKGKPAGDRCTCRIKSG